MQVILLEKIANLGDLGDQVSVKSGYGRNYLVPQKKAVPATAENIAHIDHTCISHECIPTHIK